MGNRMDEMQERIFNRMNKMQAGINEERGRSRQLAAIVRASAFTQLIQM